LLRYTLEEPAPSLRVYRHCERSEAISLGWCQAVRDCRASLAMTKAAIKTQSACRLLFGGQVQGVGFRPFVYRTAIKTGIHGWVQNCRGEVLVHAEGDAQAIEQFIHRLLQQAPAIARPVLLNQLQAGSEEVDGFVMRPQRRIFTYRLTISPAPIVLKK